MASATPRSMPGPTRRRTRSPRSWRATTDAPNLIDGAVLEGRHRGLHGPPRGRHVGRPPRPRVPRGRVQVVGQGRRPVRRRGQGGRGAATDGPYSLLVSNLIEEVGGDPDDILSDVGLLVTPRNVGLQLVGSKLSLGRARTVAETTLAALPDPADFAGEVDPEPTFGAVADRAPPTTSGSRRSSGSPTPTASSIGSPASRRVASPGSAATGPASPIPPRSAGRAWCGCCRVSTASAVPTSWPAAPRPRVDEQSTGVATVLVETQALSTPPRRRSPGPRREPPRRPADGPGRGDAPGAAPPQRAPTVDRRHAHRARALPAGRRGPHAGGDRLGR